VAGVLGLLAVLAAAFVTMAQLERRASRQRLYATKATLLARSGIEDAMARLSAGQDPEAPGNRYCGEDWNPDGILNAGPEWDNQVYRPTAVGTPADTDACPVRHAMRPSFFRALGINPRLVGMDGRQRGYSGQLSGDRCAEGNTYALQIQSGGLYVNGGDPAELWTTGYNAVLTQIFGTLAEAIDREDGLDDGKPVDQTDGNKLIVNRPDTGWTSFERIRDVALLGDQAKLDALKPYLTLHAWVDRKVIRPNADATLARTYTSWGEIKTSRNPVAPVFEGRAPVDLSWARPRRPVLLALLKGSGNPGKGLSALAFTESTATSKLNGDLVGSLVPVALGFTWSLGDECQATADRILSSASELGTWEQWEAFCNTLDFTGTSEQVQGKRDILKTNFNPNSDLNKFNPNASLWKSVDKSDLLAYSTEWSLLPVQGRRLWSVGRVADPSGRALASRVLTAWAGGPSVLRLTTQGEFACEDLGNPDLAGDEGTPRPLGTYVRPTPAPERPGAIPWGSTPWARPSNPIPSPAWTPVQGS
jgi:hypothetical protein